MTRRKLTKVVSENPRKNLKWYEWHISQNIPREYQRTHMRLGPSSLSWVIHTNRDQERLLIPSSDEENWEEKSLVCSPQCFKKN